MIKSGLELRAPPGGWCEVRSGVHRLPGSSGQGLGPCTDHTAMAEKARHASKVVALTWSPSPFVMHGQGPSSFFLWRVFHWEQTSASLLLLHFFFLPYACPHEGRGVAMWQVNIWTLVGTSEGMWTLQPGAPSPLGLPAARGPTRQPISCVS